MEGCDAVIHAAAIYEVGIPAKQHQAMYEANVAGTEHVLQRGARRPKVGKVVYVSTVGVFGNTARRGRRRDLRAPGQDFTSYYEETKSRPTRSPSG